MNVADVDAVELEVLLTECVNSVHICNNTVYSQFSGSPSGAVLTTIINTLVNLFYILLAWQHLMRETLITSGRSYWTEFTNSVTLVAYGDDLIMSVKDEFAELFNSRTISSWFATKGIVSTDSSKTSVVRPYTSLVEAEFLKRSFAFHPTRKVWMAVLAWTSVLGATQWIWECTNYHLATRVNCEMALMMSHGYGPHKFQRLKDTINSALIKKSIDPIVLTWQEVDALIYEFGYVQVF